jgi:hypothetical protein
MCSAHRSLRRSFIVDIAPEAVPSGAGRIQASVQGKDLFQSHAEALAAAGAANSTPLEARHRHRIERDLMRTEDGRWAYRYAPLHQPGFMRTPS